MTPNLSLPMNHGRRTIKVGPLIVSNNEPVTITSLEDFKSCISQYFGENRADYYRQWGMKGHNAIDVTLFDGDDILAAHDGIVTEVENDVSAGLGIVVWDKEGRYKTLYWHLKVGHIFVKVGDSVKRGQKIAGGDNTGYSTGAHLHFGLKFTDAKGNTINYNNGYKGAVDPLPYLNGGMKLLQLQGDSAVWAIIDGKRYWVANPDSLKTVKYKVEVLPATQGDYVYSYPYVAQVAFLNADSPVNR